MPRQPRQASRYLDRADKLASVIRNARSDAGFTQIDVAARSGVPYSTVRAIERARVKEPCFFAVMDICTAIGLTPARLTQMLRTKHSPRSQGPQS